MLLERKTENGVIIDKFRYKGKPIGGERVNIYAVFLHQEIFEDTPAILLLNDCGKGVDLDLMKYFFSMGYSVLMPDFSGETTENRGCGNYTIYPERIDYANYEKSKEHLLPNGNSVTDTCWFEWMSVGTFSLEFLKSICKSRIGLVGIRGGGEIVWKLMLNDGISCGVTFNATGWLAYNGVPKHSERKKTLTEDELKYIAGLDSQSYAPFVRAPMLLLGTCRDEHYDIDRAYDTYLRINKDHAKTICYSVRNNGLLGQSSQKNIKLFFNKYLMNREVFIPEPADISVRENDKTDLEVRILFDETSAVERFGIYYAEDTLNSLDREWKELQFSRRSENGEEVIPISVCETCKRVFVFAYSICSNGFTTTSKVICFPIRKRYKGMLPKEKILFPQKSGSDLFYCKMNKDQALSDYFLKSGTVEKPRVIPGYKNIPGLECKDEIFSYLVGMPTYSAEENSVLCLDLYNQNDTDIQIIFSKRDEDGTREYCYQTTLPGKEQWKRMFLKANEFEDRKGNSVLTSFKGTNKLTFKTNGSAFLVNNMIWV